MNALHRSGPAALVLSVMGLCVLSACEQEIRVIKYDPFLASLPGAQGGQPPVGERPVIPDDPHALPADQLMVKRPDGGVTFVAKVTRHLVAHLGRLMEAEDNRLIFDELISSATKAHFQAMGKDPRAEVDTFFTERRGDILALLARMPSGERSPGVQMEKVGPRALRLTVSGTGARGLRLTELWVVMEGGNWRVWWFS